VSDQLPEDKVQAMVNLVLQAVDQRLATVREELVQITNSVARSHADLEGQIAECRELCASSAGSDHLAPGADAVATRQLVDAANVLTERVTFLEARVNQYTNDRVAELHVAIERLNHQLDVSSPVRSSSSPNGTAFGADHAMSARSVVPAPSSTPWVNDGHAFFHDDPNNVAPAAARLAPLAATPRLVASSGSPPTVAEVDIDELSARLGERLSAAIERAIGS